MSYLATSKVEVFPSVRRDAVQLSARLMSEASLVNIINKLIDKDGFIITDTSSFNANSPFEFNIHGYYFNIQKAQDIFDLFASSSSLSIYANIQIDSTGDYTELYGQDDEGSYEGLEFSESPINASDSGLTVYSLRLFTRTAQSSSWAVDADSRIRFSSNIVDTSADIDGGEI